MENIETLTQPQTCVVCLMQPAGVTYTPCHHHVVCVSCDTTIVDRLAEHTTQPCPICRAPVIFRKYPIVSLFVVVNRHLLVVEMPLNATIWDLKGEIKKRAGLLGRSFPRISIHDQIPSDFQTLAHLQLTSHTMVECLAPPPPPLECLLHRLTKIRERLAFHDSQPQRRTDQELNIAICKFRESNLLEILQTAYGYQENLTPTSVTL